MRFGDESVRQGKRRRSGHDSQGDGLHETDAGTGGGPRRGRQTCTVPEQEEVGASGGLRSRSCREGTCADSVGAHGRSVVEGFGVSGKGPTGPKELTVKTTSTVSADLGTEQRDRAVTRARDLLRDH